MPRIPLTLFLLIALLLFSSCSPAPQVSVDSPPAELYFDGERALAIETEFVTNFPSRHSGQPNNRLAAEWFSERLTSLGWECSLDEWQVVLYSLQTGLQNAACRLAGQHPGEILIIAHHDQSPATIQGADNDGSGISILVHLAEIFAAEGQPRYTLKFLSTDAEEYGMLGTRRYVQTHPDTESILAGISLDNLGKNFYDGLKMEATGQFAGYGDLWLLRTAQEVARAYDGLWVPEIRSVLFQVLDQAVPVSYMDQGPLVAAGIPAMGFAGRVPLEDEQLNWDTYHSPLDTIEVQSAAVLDQSGRAAEALIRQLLVMENHPRNIGPYLYFEAGGSIFRGAPLWLMFSAFVALFFFASLFFGHVSFDQKFKVWRSASIYFFSLWLPLIGGVLLIYLLVKVGLVEEFNLYPATPKDPAILNPSRPAVATFLVCLALFFALGRMSWRTLRSHLPRLNPISVKNFGLFVIGLAGLYILLVNPFSLLFMVPLLFWFLISERHGGARALDWFFFALGGLMIYALVYFFGFVMQRMGFAILWFLLMMFSTGMIAFPMALAITAIIAAGLSMVIRPGK